MSEKKDDICSGPFRFIHHGAPKPKGECEDHDHPTGLVHKAMYEQAIQRAETAERERDEARSHPHRRHLQHRAEQAERERDALRARVEELEQAITTIEGVSQDHAERGDVYKERVAELEDTIKQQHAEMSEWERKAEKTGDELRISIDGRDERIHELRVRVAELEEGPRHADVERFYEDTPAPPATETDETCSSCAHWTGGPLRGRCGMDHRSHPSEPAADCEDFARNKGEEDDGIRHGCDAAPSDCAAGGSGEVQISGDAAGVPTGTDGAEGERLGRMGSGRHRRPVGDSVGAESLAPHDKRREADPWCDLQHCLDRALITGNHQDHVGWLVQAIRLVNAALDGKDRA